MGNTPEQDDDTQLKGIFHHGGKVGHNSQRDGRISEHCPDEKTEKENSSLFLSDKFSQDIKDKYNIGKVIVEAQGWKYNSNYGNKLIKEWSKELTEKYGPYFSIENLKNMRTIYLKLDEDYKNSDFLNFDFFILENIIVPDMQENMQ